MLIVMNVNKEHRILLLSSKEITVDLREREAKPEKCRDKSSFKECLTKSLKGSWGQ